MDRVATLAVLLIFAVLSGLVSACSPSRASGSTATATQLPSPMASPVPSLVPTRGSAAVAAATPGPVATPGASPPIVQRDLTYSAPGTPAQKMDIFIPGQSGARPSPVVVYIHGGAWSQGDKEAGVWLTPLVGQLVGQGYAVATINYRLAPQYRWPAQIEDAKCAIRFLRANASRFHLDPNSIGVIGVSAGGQLAALLGTTDPSAGLESSGGYSDQSSRVQAVVDISGPSDLSLPEFSSVQAHVAKQVFGATSPDDPVLEQASPVNYATKDDPPFLILHGEKDTLVPVHQAYELNDSLKAVGVDSTLVVVRNGGHSLSPAGGPTSPSHEQIASMVLDFLDKHLKKGES